MTIKANAFASSEHQSTLDATTAEMKQARAKLSELRESIGDNPTRQQLDGLSAASEEFTARKAASDAAIENYRLLTFGQVDAATNSPVRQWATKAATITKQALDNGVSGSNTSMVPSFFDPTLYTDPYLPTLVQGLVSQRTVDGANVEGITQASRTNNAAIVDAGDPKPESDYAYERVIIPVRVYAHVTAPYDRSLLEDASFLRDLIGGELRSGVQAAVEDKLINGTGSGLQPAGLIEAAGSTRGLGGDTRVDAVLKAITALRSFGFEPDAVVANLADYEELTLEKNDVGDYLFGGPVTAGPQRIWSKLLVPSSYCPAGTVIVANLRQSTVMYLREESRIDWAESGFDDTGTDHDMFVHNELRARGEARVGIHVWQPNAICTITGV